ncbi:MAG: hypothetical protein AB8B56_12730 [Crocinitomicaceae bacterium]
MNYLLPNKFKRVGLVVLTIGIALGSVNFFYAPDPSLFDLKMFAIINKGFASTDYFKIIENNLFDEFNMMLIILGGLMAAFSREKDEDEYIAKIRLDALLWAVYSNYIILMLTVLFVYGLPFFWVLVFNTFTTLLIFLLRFNLKLSKLKREQV